MPRKKKEEKVEEVERKEEKEKEEETEVEGIKVKDEPEVKEEKAEKTEKDILLVPLDEYIKTAVHLGTKAIMPDMRQYVYRRKADGVAVLNTKKIDEKIIVAANFLAQYAPEDILLCCKREAGYKALEAFKEVLNVKIFTRYPAGIITNSLLENFFEPKVMFIIDPWLDKNALHDAVQVHIPVISLCDTNNMTSNIDVIIPANNKAAKSIGIVLYLIAKLYMKKRGIKKELNKDDFYEIEEEGPEEKEMRAKKVKAKEEKKKEKEETETELEKARKEIKKRAEKLVQRIKLDEKAPEDGPEIVESDES